MFYRRIGLRRRCDCRLHETLDAVSFEVTDQIDPFHVIEAIGSRITDLLRSISSASARLDSKTSWTAS